MRDYDNINREIVQAIQQGKNAKENLERLFNRNRALIHRFIMPFTGFADEQDLMQEAFLGLWQAVGEFEPSNQCHFMNFARQRIQRMATDFCWRSGALIRIPSNLSEASLKLHRAAQRFASTHGRQPTDTELSTVTGLSIHTIQRVRQAERIRDTASLDAPVSTGEGEGDTLGDFIADPSDIEASVTQEQMAAKARRILWGLVESECSERQQEALRLVYQEGLNEVEAGERMGITRQGIQSLTYCGLQHLRRRTATIQRELDVEQTMLYKTGLTLFKESGESSVEKIALRRLDRIEKIS